MNIGDLEWLASEISRRSELDRIFTARIERFGIGLCAISSNATSSCLIRWDTLKSSEACIRSLILGEIERLRKVLDGCEKE